jgi:hypothetical protein
MRAALRKIAITAAAAVTIVGATAALPTTADARRLRDAPTRCNQPLGSPCVEMGAGLLLNASSPQKENGRALPGRCLGRIGDQNASYC